MNRYPLWKYIFIVSIVLFGILYALPNFFGESPAIQISSAKSSISINIKTVNQIKQLLQINGIIPKNILLDNGQIDNRLLMFVCFDNTNNQFKAKTLLEKKLNIDPVNPTYIIAFNLFSNTPKWLKSLHAFPMYLGLDLRGGVYFLMKLDMKVLLNKYMQDLQVDIRKLLREQNIIYKNIVHNSDDNQIVIQCKDFDTCNQIEAVLNKQLPEVIIKIISNKQDIKLIVKLRPEILKEKKENNIKRNISTLSRRINELSIAEPLIQQQGDDRIIVQLPGVQDIARAKNIIGRVAILEVRMVNELNINNSNFEKDSFVLKNFELFKFSNNTSILLSKNSIITGDDISTAFVSFDKNHQPAVSIDLNHAGGKKMWKATHNKIGQTMAIVLLEKNKSEILTIATIRDELRSHFQITGMKSINANNDLALLLRAGALSAPMEIIEERVIGPQLGVNNIQQGFNATLYGFIVIAIFMIIYYQLFGFLSVIALLINVSLLIAILSILQATLTLSGIAAIALTLGMAIDSNVLINERIREELYNGSLPKIAIWIGFKRAWATIIDSNVTTLIASLALLIFGSGTVRGFAIVHFLGILTSIFSAVFFSHGIVNLWYGRKKKIINLAIG